MMFILLIIGFMLAIQYKTVKEPEVRDTRDSWELREALTKEKERQMKLINEISSTEEKLAQYDTKRAQSKEQALADTLEELKVEAGLKDIHGPGIILSIQSADEEQLMGQSIIQVSPDLLKRLVNELNLYGAKEISIENLRYINTTVIRDINNETKMNGHSLNKLPLEVKVITDTIEAAEKLQKQMQVSKSADEFFMENLRISVSAPLLELTIPAFQDSIRIRNMKPVELDKGGKS
nr:DUF881 domain-containing protein [Bacillus sp. 03113]